MARFPCSRSCAITAKPRPSPCHISLPKTTANPSVSRPRDNFVLLSFVRALRALRCSDPDVNRLQMVKIPSTLLKAPQSVPNDPKGQDQLVSIAQSCTKYRSSITAASPLLRQKKKKRSRLSSDGALSALLGSGLHVHKEPRGLLRPVDLPVCRRFDPVLIPVGGGVHQLHVCSAAVLLGDVPHLFFHFGFPPHFLYGYVGELLRVAEHVRVRVWPGQKHEKKVPARAEGGREGSGVRRLGGISLPNDRERM